MLPKKYQGSKNVFSVKRTRAGLGLFTTQPIKKGSFVIEYTGTTLSSEEAEKKGGKYLFEVSSKKTIDGSGRNNLARYINHACQPNCEPEIIRGHIVIFAKKNIPADSELTYNYGPTYFKEYIKPLGCRCLSCDTKRKRGA